MTSPPRAPVGVLIVDDQAPFRLAAEQVVEATDGFAVVGTVATGEAAVDAARRLRPDLVLMDVRLPSIDGPEATRRILAGVDGPRRPVVLLLSTYEEGVDGPRVRVKRVASAVGEGAIAIQPVHEYLRHRDRTYGPAGRRQ